MVRATQEMASWQVRIQEIVLTRTKIQEGWWQKLKKESSCGILIVTQVKQTRNYSRFRVPVMRLAGLLWLLWSYFGLFFNLDCHRSLCDPVSQRSLWNLHPYNINRNSEITIPEVWISTFKGALSRWQNLKKSGWLFQVQILSSWWYHNDRAFFELYYSGIVIVIKTGLVFVGFLAVKCVFALLNFWSDACDSAPLRNTTADIRQCGL